MFLQKCKGEKTLWKKGDIIMSSVLKSLKYIEIETCNTCTRSCEWCPFGSFEGYRPKKPSFLDTKYIHSILNELAEIHFNGQLSLFSINEPLMDKRIISGELISLSKAELKDAILLLITNGDLLTDLIICNMFEAGLDKLLVSCYDDETYNKTEFYKQKYSYAIDHLDKRYFNNGDWEYNRAGSVNCKDDSKYKQCHIPVFQSIIGYDGEVRLCCYDALGVSKLGNIKSNKLSEILDNDKINSLRKQIQENRTTISPCDVCNVEGTIEWLYNNWNF